MHNNYNDYPIRLSIHLSCHILILSSVCQKCALLLKFDVMSLCVMWCCRYPVPLVWIWASPLQTASCRHSPDTSSPSHPTSSPSTTSTTAWLLVAGCVPTSWSWRVSEHTYTYTHTNTHSNTHTPNLKLICSSMSLLSQSALKCPGIISS